MTMPQDVVDRVTSDFPAEKAKELVELLRETTDDPRLQRCVVVGAEGDLNRFMHGCVLVEIDSRDLIMFGEYDKRDNRIFDFNKPIPEARLAELDGD